MNKFFCLLFHHKYKIIGKEFWFNKGEPDEDYPYKIRIYYTCTYCGKKKWKDIICTNKEQYKQLL